MCRSVLRLQHMRSAFSWRMQVCMQYCLQSIMYVLVTPLILGHEGVVWDRGAAEYSVTAFPPAGDPGLQRSALYLEHLRRLHLQAAQCLQQRDNLPRVWLHTERS